MKFLTLSVCFVMTLAGILCSAHAQQTTPLFDGKTLDGWTTVDGSPVTEGWEAVNGTIHLPKNSGAGNIVTAKEYGDFGQRFEWKISKVHGFGENRNGKIMLTEHGAEVWYRSITITTFTEPVVVDGVASAVGRDPSP